MYCVEHKHGVAKTFETCLNRMDHSTTQSTQSDLTITALLIDISDYFASNITGIGFAIMMYGRSFLIIYSYLILHHRYLSTVVLFLFLLSYLGKNYVQLCQ